MPDRSIVRGAAARAAHARPATPRRPRSVAEGRLRSRAGLGIAGVAAIAAVIALAGWLGGAGGGPGPVANVVSPSATPSVTPPGSASLSSGGATMPAPSADAGGSTAPSDGATDAPGPGASPTPTIPAAALQRTLDAVRTKASLPGVSVAILWDDGRVWLGASGSADIAAKAPMTTGTAFPLASISKTFTAAVVLQLVDEGHLTLDDRVARLLPSYRLDPRITVRMLLDHTSGLPDFFLNPRIDRALQSAPDATWTPQRAWKYVSTKRPVPGRTWAYSNTNYLLLGELVEAVTGRPLATEIRKRLLDPLDLTTTWFQAVERPREGGGVGYRLLPVKGGGLRAVPVGPAGDVMPFRSVVTAAGGAGSIASTASDAARWMQAFASGRLLSPAMQAAMLGDVALTRKLHARIPYGLGIQVVSLYGRGALGHSGRYLGFRNVVRYLPAEGLTIAVLTNQSVYDPSRIAVALLKRVLPPPAPSASPSSSPAQSPGPSSAPYTP